MHTKQKGTVAERELIALLWAKGFAAIRAAGSGSARHPSPDVIAGKDGRCLVFECKSITSGVRYLPKAEIDQLLTFSTTFGADAYIAVRFNRNDWHFMLPELGGAATLRLSVEDVRLKGLLLDEIL